MIPTQHCHCVRRSYSLLTSEATARAGAGVARARGGTGQQPQLRDDLRRHPIHLVRRKRRRLALLAVGRRRRCPRLQPARRQLQLQRVLGRRRTSRRHRCCRRRWRRLRGVGSGVGGGRGSASAKAEAVHHRLELGGLGSFGLGALDLQYRVATHHTPCCNMVQRPRSFGLSALDPALAHQCGACAGGL